MTLKLLTSQNSEAPRYAHDCSNCSYLGQFEAQDLYYCAGVYPTVIARHGENGEYYSGLDFGFGMNRFLTEALKRAIAADLYVINGEHIPLSQPMADFVVAALPLLPEAQLFNAIVDVNYDRALRYACTWAQLCDVTATPWSSETWSQLQRAVSKVMTMLAQTKSLEPLSPFESIAIRAQAFNAIEAFRLYVTAQPKESL